MGVLGPVLLRFCSFMLLVVSGGSQSIVFWRVGVWRIVIHVFRCEWWFAIDGVECCPLVVGVLIVGCEWQFAINDTSLSLGGWLLPLLSLVVSGRSQSVVFLCVGAGTAIVNLFCCESRLTTDACRRPSDPWQATSENSTDAGRIPETDIRPLRGGYREWIPMDATLPAAAARLRGSGNDLTVDNFIF